jgi:hypothetical protein
VHSTVISPGAAIETAQENATGKSAGSGGSASKVRKSSGGDAAPTGATPTK